MESQQSINICLLGSPGVGKTLIYRRLIDKQVDPEEIQPTVNFETTKKSKKLLDGKSIHFNISTISGKLLQYPETVKAEAAFRDAHALIFVCDINDYQTLEDIKTCFDALAIDERDDILFLLANKSDLNCDQRVPFREVESFAQKFSANSKIQCFELSALSEGEVEEIFLKIINEIREDFCRRNPQSSFSKSHSKSKQKSADSESKSCEIF